MSFDRISLAKVGGAACRRPARRNDRVANHLNAGPSLRTLEHLRAGFFLRLDSRDLAFFCRLLRLDDLFDLSSFSGLSFGGATTSGSPAGTNCL